MGHKFPRRNFWIIPITNCANKKRCSRRYSAGNTQMGMGTPPCVLASSGVQNRLSVLGTLRHLSPNTTKPPYRCHKPQRQRHCSVTTATLDSMLLSHGIITQLYRQVSYCSPLRLSPEVLNHCLTVVATLPFDGSGYQYRAPVGHARASTLCSTRALAQ